MEASGRTESTCAPGNSATGPGSDPSSTNSSPILSNGQRSLSKQWNTYDESTRTRSGSGRFLPKSSDSTPAMCSVADCTRPVKTRGWCNAHYQRWYKTGDPLKIRPGIWDGYVRPTCSVDGCDALAHARGLCPAHFCRMRRHGDPEFITRAPNGTPYWDLVDKSGDCWEWLGGKSSAGYGEWRRPDGGQVYVHRWAVLLATGAEPPDEMHVHHDCLNPSCVRPEHLMVLTPKEHRRRHRELRRMAELTVLNEVLGASL